jgi:hypothetical protein
MSLKFLGRKFFSDTNRLVLDQNQRNSLLDSGKFHVLRMVHENERLKVCDDEI